ncbi:MAG: hypothetical protein ACOVMN_06440 [Flexibacteraceae bacterium]
MENSLKINTRYGSFTASQYFEPTSESMQLQQRVRQLCTQLNEQLVLNEVGSGNITLRVITAEGKQLSQSLDLADGGNRQLLEVTAQFLLQQSMAAGYLPVQHIQLSINNLVYKYSNYSIADSAQKELLQNLDKLSKKYGKVVKLNADSYYKYELTRYVAGF